MQSQGESTYIKKFFFSFGPWQWEVHMPFPQIPKAIQTSSHPVRLGFSHKQYSKFI